MAKHLHAMKHEHHERGDAKREFSSISQSLFLKLLDYIPDRDEVFFEKWNGEKKIGSSYIDFVYKNKIIEFNGNYFHADPRIYHANMKIMSEYAKDVWERDEKKTKELEESGYKVLVVWEDSFIKEPDRVVELCINFLLSGTSMKEIKEK